MIIKVSAAVLYNLYEKKIASLLTMPYIFTGGKEQFKPQLETLSVTCTRHVWRG